MSTANSKDEKNVVCKFVVDCAKKHSVLYREVGDKPVLRSLYVSNEAVAELGNPKALEIHIFARG
jgi:hypothetical protein